MQNLLIVLSLVLAMRSCPVTKPEATIPDASLIHYEGRIDVQPDKSTLTWPGSSIHINFEGTSVKAVLEDELGENYYYVIVDGKVAPKLHLNKTKETYVLASNLPAGQHTLELFKLTESEKGATWFYGFELENGKLLDAPVVKKRKIEFFGDSITCGYADEDSTGLDRGTAPFENNYLSYAAITARNFDAEYYCTAKSGIGMLVSWYPLIMPEMYNRLDARDEQSLWDFNRYQPDVVVINLFQNDSWLFKLPNHEQFVARFGTKTPTSTDVVKAYEAFVKSIRRVYPQAKIICALGNMDASSEGLPWPGYIRQAVTQMNDKNMFTLIFPYKNTPGHPSIKEQQDMANQLIAFISQNIKW